MANANDGRDPLARAVGKVQPSPALGVAPTREFYPPPGDLKGLSRVQDATNADSAKLSDDAGLRQDTTQRSRELYGYAQGGRVKPFDFHKGGGSSYGKDYSKKAR